MSKGKAQRLPRLRDRFPCPIAQHGRSRPAISCCLSKICNAGHGLHIPHNACLRHWFGCRVFFLILIYLCFDDFSRTTREQLRAHCSDNYGLSLFMLCATSLLIRTGHNVADNILGRSDFHGISCLSIRCPPLAYLLRSGRRRLPYFSCGLHI